MEKQYPLAIPKNADLKRYQIEINRGLEYAMQNNHLDLVWIPANQQIAFLRIIQNKHGHHVPLAEVIPPSQVRIIDLVDPSFEQYPHEFILDVSIVTFADMARRLYCFLHDFHPEVEHLPTNVYSSSNAFKNGITMAEIKPDKITFHTALTAF